jgi:hypothetical protein
MCNFASFSLTKTSEFWYASESHTDIDERHGLHVDGCRGPNVLHVEITPPDGKPKAPLDEWVFRIDQDIMPEWFDREEAERRTRSALARRAAEERWMIDEISADGKSSTAGYAGTATAGDDGTATAGDAGTATAGNRGTATAGNRGTATAGDDGTATAGYAGTATAGDAGTATAGYAGEIRIRYYDPKFERYRVCVGYIGENGIDPNTAYVVVDAKLTKKS